MAKKNNKKETISKPKKTTSKSTKKKRAIESCPSVVKSQKEAAKYFKVSVRTIQRWIEEDCPVNKDKTYNLLEIQEWKLKREYERDRDDEEQRQEELFGETYSNAETRWKIGQANKVELENKIKEGDYIPREDAVRALKESVRLAKRQFLALPRQVAPQIVGLDVASVQQILSARIKEIIEGFAKGKFK